MKPKSITKKAKIKGRKRPPSVLKKAWETRRKNAAHRASLPGQMAGMIYGYEAGPSKLPGLASLVKDTPTSETAIHRSEAVQAAGINPAYDPAAEIADIKDNYRERQLCGFVADFQIISRGRGSTDVTPIMLSWEQARAIHHFLHMRGYSGYNAPTAL